MSRLTVLHTEASCGWGGQEKRILEEARGLAGRGYRLLISAPPESNLLLSAKKSGLETFPFEFKSPFSPKVTLQILKLLKKEKVSILNTHSSIDSWVASPAGKFAKIPVIRTRHVSTHVNRFPLSRLPYTFLCDKIIVTAEATGRQLVEENRIPEEKIVSIPTGINLEEYSRAKESGRLRRELSIPEGVPLVGMVGVLRSWKGHRYFLEACPVILKENPQVKFVIVGDGPQRKNIENMINSQSLKENVFMTGYREDIPEVLNDMDIVVLPSVESEGVPQSILQALAMEKPVIGTSVGGIPEVIIPGKTGVLVPPKDSNALAQAVLKSLRERVSAERLACEGRKLVEEKYSMEGMLDRVEELYGKLLKK